ncbi:hypothetical protein ACWCPS_20685 [Streptomyces mauvecolor]
MFQFKTQQEFAEFCEAHGATHPYLIEDPEPINKEEEPAMSKITIRAGQWEEDRNQIQVRIWREGERDPFVNIVLGEWHHHLYREMPAMTLWFLAKENGVANPPKIFRKDYHNDYNPFLYDHVGECEG